MNCHGGNCRLLTGPRYIRTPIMSDEVQKRVASKGVEFALQEDALKTVLRITSDRNVNGKYNI